MSGIKYTNKVDVLTKQAMDAVRKEAKATYKGRDPKDTPMFTSTFNMKRKDGRYLKFQAFPNIKDKAFLKAVKPILAEAKKNKLAVRMFNDSTYGGRIPAAGMTISDPKISGNSDETIMTGPRGGQYYITKNGNKAYI